MFWVRVLSDSDWKFSLNYNGHSTDWPLDHSLVYVDSAPSHMDHTYAIDIVRGVNRDVYVISSSEIPLMVFEKPKYLLLCFT